MGGCFREALARGDMPRITRVIQAVVARSFVKHPLRSELGLYTEARARTKTCMFWYRTMVEEHDAQGKLVYGFECDRALSQLGSALDADLNKRPWEPERCTLWVPDQAVLTA